MNRYGDVNMTIFRIIVEEFLIDGIDKIQATSKGYDEGAVNRVRGLTFLGGKRSCLVRKETCSFRPVKE